MCRLHHEQMQLPCFILSRFNYYWSCFSYSGLGIWLADLQGVVIVRNSVLTFSMKISFYVLIPLVNIHSF